MRQPQGRRAGDNDNDSNNHDDDQGRTHGSLVRPPHRPVTPVLLGACKFATAWGCLRITKNGGTTHGSLEPETSVAISFTQRSCSTSWSVLRLACVRDDVPHKDRVPSLPRSNLQSRPACSGANSPRASRPPRRSTRRASTRACRRSTVTFECSSDERFFRDTS